MKRSFVLKAVRLPTAVLLGAAVVLTGAPAASSDNGNQTASLEKSIVFLQTDWSGFVQVPPGADKAGQGYWTDKLKYTVTCTGWYVSKSGDIVTAGHCVDPGNGRQVIIDGYLSDQKATNLKDQAYANWVVEGDQKGSPVGRSTRAIQPNGVDGATITSLTTLQVIDSKGPDAGDVALLHLPNMNKETPGLVVAQKAPQVGEQVTSIGFPGDIQDITDQTQIARASFKSGTVSSDQVTPTGVTQIEVSTQLAPGMSGGPTVNKDDEVVGVNSNGLTKQAGFNFITYTPDLRTFLQSHNVPLVQPPAPPSGGSNTLWYVIGGIVVVLAVAAGLLLLLLRRRRTPQFAGAGAPMPSYPMQGPGPYPMPGSVPTQGFAPETSQTGPSSQMAATAPPPQMAATAPPPPTPESADSAVIGRVSTGPISGPSGTQPAGGDTTTSQTGTVGNFCPACGAAHRPDDHFCPQCGKTVT
jgi:LPXTG-motif cell wall-anchored protein